MNTVNLILLYQLIAICSSETLNQYHPSLPLHHIKLAIVENGKLLKDVNLTPTKRVLANEHLPVWTLSGTIDVNSIDNTDGDELKRHYGVMEQLGKFTVYQQPKTSSSAIYFHKRREIDGMIGYEFLIKNLSIDEIHSIGGTILTVDRSGVYRRPEYISHEKDHKITVEDPEAGVTYQGPVHTYGARLYDGYPEVLVIISWDLADEWTQNVQESDRYTTIVSNVLTLFNGVDMLYSKLKYTNIQINIAGIIIGTARKSFDFLNDCFYLDPKGHDNFMYKLDGVCVTNVFRRFLGARKNTIPLDSYDMAIFLTRDTLYNMMGNVGDSQYKKFQRIIGIVGSTYKLYETRERNIGFILVGTVTTNQYFEHYPSLVHEMAHLMTVRHDKPQYFNCDGECCGNIMKTRGNWCDQCLSWSETSEKSFYFFFSSPNCCAFINSPRSLNPPGRHKMLTADEQCQCYGYKHVQKFLDFRDILWGFCKVELRCNGKSNQFLRTVIPMDGTPCGKEKVCWQRKCAAIETFELSDEEESNELLPIL